MQKIKITNSQDSVTIDIEGTIGVPEQWQFDEPQQRVATYETFRSTLQQIETLEAKSVVVNIRSTGGDVNDALLIYEALISLPSTITTRCYGYVASAATVIAQAASEGLREISPNALYLVHNSQCAVEGTAHELTQRLELLRKTDERLAELYARRSGGEAATFTALMGEENGAGRWLNAQEAIEIGLADKVIEGQVVEEVTTEQSEQPETEEVAPVSEAEEGVIAKALVQVRGMIGRIGERLGVTQNQENNETKQVVKPATKSPVAESSTERITSANRASQIALTEGQNLIRRSRVSPHEDPSLNEARRSANESAYEYDARRLRGKL